MKKSLSGNRDLASALTRFNPALHGGEFPNQTGQPASGSDRASMDGESGSKSSTWTLGLPDRPGLPQFSSCGPGWHPLIEQTLDAVEARLALTGSVAYQVVQIKEKLGQLRIYLQPLSRDLADSLDQPPSQVQRLQRLEAMRQQTIAEADSAVDSGARLAVPSHRLGLQRSGPLQGLYLNPDVRPRRWLITEVDRRTDQAQHWFTDTLRLPFHRLTELLLQSTDESADSHKLGRLWPYLWTVTEYGDGSADSDRRSVPVVSWVCELPWLPDNRLQKITALASELSAMVCEICGADAERRNTGGWLSTRCEHHAPTATGSR